MHSGYVVVFIVVGVDEVVGAVSVFEFVELFFAEFSDVFVAVVFTAFFVEEGFCFFFLFFAFSLFALGFFFRSVAFDHDVCSVVFYAVFIHFFACNDAGVADEIHVRFCVFRLRNEAQELLRKGNVRAFGHYPAVEPDVAAFFGNSVVEFRTVFVFVSGVERVNSVSAPCEVDRDLAGGHVFFAAIDFKSVDVFLED